VNKQNNRHRMLLSCSFNTGKIKHVHQVLNMTHYIWMGGAVDTGAAISNDSCYVILFVLGHSRDKWS